MGRPREFEEEKVLEAAGDMFWAKGFEATSTRDLTACTGLTPSSMYAAFGDKRAFFRRVLDHYLEHTSRERIARLEASLPPGAAIAAFFAEIIERSLSDVQQRGCMLVNSALDATSRDPDFRAAIANELAALQGFFHRCVIAGQHSGEIRASLSADDAARHLLSVLLGVRVLARVRPERELLTGAVRPVLTMLLQSPQSLEGSLS
jgi:TetR/AcrR family transcriptional repressor of nem operon